LCLLSGEEVCIPTLTKIVASAPKNPAEAEDEYWYEHSTCGQLLIKAAHREFDRWQRFDAETTRDYWVKEFCTLAPKTRSGITSMFTSMADLLNRRPFRMLFSERSPKGRDLLPEYSHTGAVILLNLPIKEFGTAGQLAQLIYKYMWQQAVERRDISDADQCPVFLWADEAQNFVTEYDMQFQATARSSRACTVYLTQNLPNYYAAMGGEHSRHRVDSLVGNLQTRIWHSNGDPETNQHAAETIGKSWQKLHTDSRSAGTDSFSISESSAETMEFDVPPQIFTRLRKGGPENQRVVEGIIYQTGRHFSNDKTWIIGMFGQQ
jgi:type IV secretory pathway TraG/TraD family ATPase VirD4